MTRGDTLALLPLSILALSPVFVEPMQWWAASALALPMQISLGLMVIAACRWTESRNRPDLAWLAAAYLFGLFFWHKSLLLTVPAAFVLVALARGSVVQRLRSVLCAARSAVPHLRCPISCSSATSPRRAARATTSEPTLEGRTFSDASSSTPTVRRHVPAVAAGWPLGEHAGRQRPVERSPPRPSPRPCSSSAPRCSSGSPCDHRQVLWLLVLPLIYTVLSLGVVLFSTRADDVWDVMTLERYFVDPIAVAMLAVALMIRAARPVGPDAAAAVAARSRTEQVVLTLMAMSLVVSNIQAADRIGTHPGSALDRRTCGRTSYASPSSAPTTHPWSSGTPTPRTRSSNLCGGTRRPSCPTCCCPSATRWRSASRPTRCTRSTRTEGSSLWSISRLTSSEAGPVAGCGYYVEPGGTASVDMTMALFHWGWGLELSAFSAAVATSTSTRVDRRVDDVAAGPQHPVRPARSGEISETVTVSVPAGSTGPFCINDIHVGEPRPAPDVPAPRCRRHGGPVTASRRMALRSVLRVGCPRDGERQHLGPVVIGRSAAPGRARRPRPRRGPGRRAGLGERGSWFIGDDFNLMTRLYDVPLTVTELFTPHDSQLMPGGILSAWVMTNAGPQNWTVGAGIIIGFQAVASLSCLLMLVSVFGKRWAIIPLLLVYLASPLTLTAYMWWAAAINQVPLHAAFFLTMTAAVCYFRTRRLLWLGLVVAGVLLGMAFYVKAVLILPVVAAVAFLFFGPRTTDGRHRPCSTRPCRTASPRRAPCARSRRCGRCS